jgi:hypothetical protein
LVATAIFLLFLFPSFSDTHFRLATLCESIVSYRKYLSVRKEVGRGYLPLFHLLKSCEVGNFSMVKLLIGTSTFSPFLFLSLSCSLSFSPPIHPSVRLYRPYLFYLLDTSLIFWISSDMKVVSADAVWRATVAYPAGSTAPLIARKHGHELIALYLEREIERTKTPLSSSSSLTPLTTRLNPVRSTPMTNSSLGFDSQTTESSTPSPNLANASAMSSSPSPFPSPGSTLSIPTLASFTPLAHSSSSSIPSPNHHTPTPITPSRNRESRSSIRFTRKSSPIRRKSEKSSMQIDPTAITPPKLTFPSFSFSGLPYSSCSDLSNPPDQNQTNCDSSTQRDSPYSASLPPPLLSPSDEFFPSSSYPCQSCQNYADALNASEELIVTTLSNLFIRSFFEFAQRIRQSKKLKEKNILQDSYDLIEDLLINSIPSHLRIRIEDKILELSQNSLKEKGKEREEGEEMSFDLIDSMRRRLNNKEYRRRYTLFADVSLADQSNLDSELYASKGKESHTTYYSLSLSFFLSLSLPLFLCSLSSSRQHGFSFDAE